MSLLFITATRQSEEEFHRSSPLHLSLARIAQVDAVKLIAYTTNQRGLPEVYNQGLTQAQEDDIVVFVHDDVWIDDWLIAMRLREALTQFDVVGVVGSTVRHPGQDAWWRYQGTPPSQYDFSAASGAINHGQLGQANAERFGPNICFPTQVKLLDGVFLAARAGTLKKAGVQFDPRFQFHYYDMDFCRTCEQAGLRLGTWPIALTHASRGNLSQKWKDSRVLYLEKWQS